MIISSCSGANDDIMTNMK